ncbi:MAG: cob(I)yrinic acid a,c-diamide adenosyltransferase [Clostridia bacterium]
MGIHIYTGDGKGKTTAAVGLGVRACGRGMKVLMVQFLKGAQTGEMFTIEKLKPDFELCRHKEIGEFSWNMTQEELKEMKQHIENLFQYAVKEAMSGRRDLIILDEIMAAITSGFIAMDEVLSFAKNKPSGLELVMTGRSASLKMIQFADYVSEIKAVKHPFAVGVPAREGIEF